LIFGEYHYFVWKKASQKHKMTMFSKNFGGHVPFGLPLATPMLRRPTNATQKYTHLNSSPAAGARLKTAQVSIRAIVVARIPIRGPLHHEEATGAFSTLQFT